jgi:hypothetical protein
MVACLVMRTSIQKSAMLYVSAGLYTNMSRVADRFIPMNTRTSMHATVTLSTRQFTESAINLVRLSSLTTHGRMCAALRMMQIPHVMFHTSAKTLLRLTSGIVTSLSVTQAITMPLHATHLPTMQMPAFSPLYTLVAIFSVSFQLAVLVVVLARS